MALFYYLQKKKTITKNAAEDFVISKRSAHNVFFWFICRLEKMLKARQL